MPLGPPDHAPKVTSMPNKCAIRLNWLTRLLWGVATPVLFFAAQFAMHKRSAIGSAAILLLVASSATWIASTIWIVTSRRAFSLATLVLAVVSAGLWLFETFTLIYWNMGTPANFGRSLTHLDSSYLMLGILTTAGTGAIEPISQSARLVVTVQFVVDLVFVGVVLGTLVSRVSAERLPSKDGRSSQNAGI